MRPSKSAASPPLSMGEARAGSNRRLLLAWSFAVFNSLRLLAYFPTMWAIWASADSQQHSWFTWLTWTGANATMAAWLYEEEGRMTRAVVVNACNALMCLVTLLLIVALRM